jgi:hypothetical protein
MRMALRIALVCAGVAGLASPGMAFWRCHPAVVINMGAPACGASGAYGAYGYGYGVAPMGYGAMPYGGYGAAPCGFGAAPSCGGYGAGYGCSGFGAAPSCSGYGAGPGCSGYGAAPACPGFGTSPDKKPEKKDQKGDEEQVRRLEKRLDKLIVTLEANKSSAGSRGAIVTGNRPAEGDLRAMTREWQNRRSAAVAAERSVLPESPAESESPPLRPPSSGVGVAGR